jgi:GTP-binding protein
MGASEGRNPIDDFEIINNEIIKYGNNLDKKESIVIANKMDLPDAKENLKAFKAKFPELKVFEISALNNEGLKELINYLGKKVSELDEVELYNKGEIESHILFKYKNEAPFTIHKNGNVWELSGREIENLFYMTRFTEDEAVQRFGRKLKGMGVDKALEEAGAKRGDEVKLLDYIFVFKDSLLN